MRKTEKDLMGVIAMGVIAAVLAICAAFLASAPAEANPYFAKQTGR